MADYNLGPFRVRPRGTFSPTTNYRYLDLVTYNGSSFICTNLDTIDGTAIVGVLPEGQFNSELYWQCIAHKGDEGTISDEYQSFITITDGTWNFNKSNKVIIPNSGKDYINISNVYSGSCGIMITNKNLTLPSNSEFSIDFNYITAGTNQYYMYTFIYGDVNGGTSDKFIWNRTVINR